MKPYQLDLTEHENLIQAMKKEPTLSEIPDFVPPTVQFETEFEDQGRPFESDEDDLEALEREQRQGELEQKQIQDKIKSLEQMDYQVMTERLKHVDDMDYSNDNPTEDRKDRNTDLQDLSDSALSPDD